MSRRNTAITWFVTCWLTVFLYETLRLNYLSPLIGRPLPKLALLFPPAGWIMFYEIDKTYGFAEVYGTRDGQPQPIDPHKIFETKGVGYDNIHRNALVGVLSQDRAPAFCHYLRRKLPQYESFAVLYGQYPDLIADPKRVGYRVAYRCP